MDNTELDVKKTKAKRDRKVGPQKVETTVSSSDIWITLPFHRNNQTELALRMSLSRLGMHIHSLETSNGPIHGITISVPMEIDKITPMFAMLGIEAAPLQSLPFELPLSGERSRHCAAVTLIVLVRELNHSCDDHSSALMLPTLTQHLLSLPDEATRVFLMQSILRAKVLLSGWTSDCLSLVIQSVFQTPTVDEILMAFPAQADSPGAPGDIQSDGLGIIPSGTSVVLEVPDGMCNWRLLAHGFAKGQRFIAKGNVAGVIKLNPDGGTNEAQLAARIKQHMNFAIRNKQKLLFLFKLRGPVSVTFLSQLFQDWGVFGESPLVFGSYKSEQAFESGMSIWTQSLGADHYSRLDAPGVAAKISFCRLGSMTIIEESSL